MNNKSLSFFIFIAIILFTTVVIKNITKPKLNEKDQIVRDLSICAVSESCVVDQIIDSFSKGKSRDGYWIAKKSNDKWEVVVSGNGFPACAEIDRFSVVRDIYGNCLESNGELRF